MKKVIAILIAALVLTAPIVSQSDVRLVAGHGEGEVSFGG